jgi:hypothetical protein
MTADTDLLLHCWPITCKPQVIGSVPELGSWHVEAAPRMQWQEGHKWVLETRLPRTAFEYKVIVTSGNEVRWEQGVNRVVQVKQIVL